MAEPLGGRRPAVASPGMVLSMARGEAYGSERVGHSARPSLSRRLLEAAVPGRVEAGLAELRRRLWAVMEANRGKNDSPSARRWADRCTELCEAQKGLHGFDMDADRAACDALTAEMVEEMING